MSPLSRIPFLGLFFAVIILPSCYSEYQIQCKKDMEYKLMHFDTCYKYYECDHGKRYEKRCFPLLQRYDNATQNCQWFWKTPCETSPPPPESNITLPVCSPNDIYSRLYPGRCDQYFYCNRGILTVRSCNLFQRYDPGEKTCKLFFRYSCSVQQLPVSRSKNIFQKFINI